MVGMLGEARGVRRDDMDTSVEEDGASVLKFDATIAEPVLSSGLPFSSSSPSASKLCSEEDDVLLEVKAVLSHF